MNFQDAPLGYDKTDQDRTRHEIIQADKLNRKTTGNVEIGKQKLVIPSPDGTRWNITVDNAGNLIPVAL